MNRLTNILLWCLFMSAVAPPLGAQDVPRQYKAFPIGPDVENRFKERMQTEQDLARLKNLVKTLAADPDKMKNFKLDDDLKKSLATASPEIREFLKEWIKKNPPEKKQSANVQEIRQELNKILEKAAKNPPRAEPSEPPKANVAAPEDKGESLAEVTERAMKQAENSKLGKWLRESPAWHQALEDLRTSMNDPNAARFKLEDWQKHLEFEDGSMWQFGEGALERLRQLPTPSFEGWTPKLPAIGSPPSPNFGAPSVSTVGMWILLAATCLLICWQLLRWTRPAAPPAESRASLGPWPVRPEAVTTRAELMLAFDYLALLTLGLDAKSWNHQAVARGWREKSPATAEFADTLAGLYEQSRYVQGVGPLTEAERDRARQSLQQIAEAL